MTDLNSATIELPAATSRRCAGAARAALPAGERMPRHWVPLLPVRVDPDAREVRLARAAVLALDGAPHIVRARGRLLVDETAPNARLLIREEEVPREGAIVRRSYQAARWLDGRLFVWAGHRKIVGRGEGSSGLALRFDRAVAALRAYVIAGLPRRLVISPRYLAPGEAAPPGCVSPSAPPRCLDGGDVDLLHRHHRLEGTLRLTATSRTSPRLARAG